MLFGTDCERVEQFSISSGHGCLALTCQPVTTTAVAEPAGPPGTDPPGPPGDADATAEPRTPLGLFAAVLTLLMTIAYSPVVNYQSWTPKAALVPFVLAVGLPCLWANRRGPWRQAALAGMALVLVAALAALFAVNHTTAVFGLYGWGTGLVFVAALPSAWAIGTRLDDRARADVRLALVAGIVANVAVAVAELRFDLEFARLTLVEGRPPGFMGGSVPFTQLVAAGVGLAAASFSLSRRQWWTLALVPVVGVGVEVAGGRFGYAVLVAAVVWVAVRHRLRAAAVFAALAAVGLLLGGVAGRGTEAKSASSRIAGSGTSGVGTRIENWKVAADAFTSRPILGTGPGTYAAATGARRTLKLARLEGADRLYADAHNVVVEYATTTGIAGLAAFLAFGWFALRPARGWAAGAALALAAMHAVEPQQVALTPLLFLLAGVASPPIVLSTMRVVLPGRRLGARVARGTSLLVAAVASGSLLFGDYQLRQSDLDFTIGQARSGMRALPRWKDPADLLARNYLYHAIVEDDPALYEQSRRWRLEGAQREPTNSEAWSKLADVELRLLRLEPAEAHFHRALRTNPQSVIARIGLAQVLLASNNAEAAIDVLEEAKLRQPGGQNLVAVDELLTQARRRAALGS